MQHPVLIADPDPAIRRLVRAHLEQEPTFAVLAETTTGPETLLTLIQHRPALVFLSTQLPELDGLGVLKAIWPHYQPHVVLLAGHDQVLLHLLEDSAVPYLLKPLDELCLQPILERMKTTLAQPQLLSEADLLVRQLLSEKHPQPKDYLRRMLVKDNRKLFFIKVDDILYFDASGNYITLHTPKKNYTIYESLTQLEQRLDPADFTRINRSYIINLNYVEELECYFNGEYLVTLTGGHHLKWTRFYRDNVKAFLTKNS